MSDALPPVPADPAAYAEPPLHCDLILKGGIVSGVVYPSALCELAQTYRFHNLGGTSSGAMAAAAAAAAEHGRRTGQGRHFARLAAVPGELGATVPANGRSALFNLFQPAPQARPLFALFLAAQGGGGLPALGLALARGFPLAALLGALPGLGLVAVLVVAARALGAAIGDAPAAFVVLVGLLLGLALALAGTLLAAGLRAGLLALRELPEIWYGACTGAAAPGGVGPGLTDWLADLLNELAGKPFRAAPLTFGDLRGPEEGDDARRINLELITTCLTLGRPVRIGAAHPELARRFFFRRDELAQFFPAWVIDWMLQHPRSLAPDQAPPAGFDPLPAMEDLPVVVAARLSLSFPLLLSALPLYTIDRSPFATDRTPQRCLFSDGGICSNFPIHFFDQPLPRWPTFGINLRPFHPEQPVSKLQLENVWMPRTNREGRVPDWQALPVAGLGRVPAFVQQIVGTGLNWRDNQALLAPGFLDRIAHIFLTDAEGGLNLSMSPRAIARLAERGQAAGRLLVDRYAAPPRPGITIGWDNHRWVRYRAMMEFVQGLLDRLATVFYDRSLGSSYSDLLEREPGAPPTSYPFTSLDREGARLGVEAMVQLHGTWTENDVDMADGAPRPGPELRIAPRQ